MSYSARQLLIIEIVAYSGTQVGAVKELFVNMCPRCESETLELDTPIVNIGKNRQMHVSLRQCPKCRLLFYEALK